MATRGRWGVTRDDKGELADLWSWPWYWRYPAGLAIAAVSAWAGVAILDSDKPEWQALVIGGGGLLCALAVMYELGCLVMVLAVLAAAYMGLSALFPGVRHDWTWSDAGLVAAFVYVFWLIGRYTDRLQAAERAIATLQNQLVDATRDRVDATDYLHVELRELRRKLEKLEKDSDPDWG